MGRRPARACMGSTTGPGAAARRRPPVPACGRTAVPRERRGSTGGGHIWRRDGGVQAVRLRRAGGLKGVPRPAGDPSETGAWIVPMSCGRPPDGARVSPRPRSPTPCRRPARACRAPPPLPAPPFLRLLARAEVPASNRRAIRGGGGAAAFSCFTRPAATAACPTRETTPPLQSPIDARLGHVYLCGVGFAVPSARLGTPTV